MKFVVVGFGRVGMRTVRILQSEGHEIVIVESDPAKVERARDEGLEVIHGDGAEEPTLSAAGLDDTDAIAGLTGDLNTNYSVCVIGRAHGCRTVLRVDEDFSEDLYDQYKQNVDEIVYPERLGAAGAKTALLGGDFNVLADLTETLSVASVKVPEDSPIIGTRVVELDLAGEARVYAHARAGEAMTIPLPRTTVKAGDSLAVMAAPDMMDTVRSRFKGESVES